MKKSNKEKPQWPIHDEMDLRIAEKLQRMDDYITREKKKSIFIIIIELIFIVIVVNAAIKGCSDMRQRRNACVTVTQSDNVIQSTA